DWIEERGGPDGAARAEFIRLQCALATGDGGPGRQPLRQRERELLARHEAAWAAPVRALAMEGTFRRGFVEHVEADARAFVEGAAALFRLAPVQSLRLYWGPGLVAPPERGRFMYLLAECPELARLRALDLGNNYLGSVGTRALAVSPYLTRLE